jgi:predicted dehydrogenase
MSSSKKIKVGFIGTGKPRSTEGSTGFGMAYEHAMGFQALKGFELAACADIVPDNAKAFASYHRIPAVYTDYRRMLKRERLDVLSICTWPDLHEPMVAAAIASGVRAIHCEKPVAPTWAAARRMAALAQRRKVQLTFNHQRRFGAPVQKALQLVRQGKIGKLRRMESFVWNLYDSGPHQVDMMQMFNGEVPARWVMGQVDGRYGRKSFGIPVDNHCLAHICYQNDIQGLVASSRSGLGGWGHLRLMGTAGEIEVGAHDPVLRVRLKGQAELKSVPMTWDYFDPAMTVAAVKDSMEAWKRGTKPQLGASNALQTAEIIFAVYESSRRRGRVDLPLKNGGNALVQLLEAGDIKVVPKPKIKDWKIF